MPTVHPLLPDHKPQFLDSNGDPLSGGKLFVYGAGGSTKATTYTESDGVTPNANPVVLDSRGEPPNGVHVATGTYKLVLAPSTDTDPPTSAIWTRDNIRAANDLESIGTQLNLIDGLMIGSNDTLDAGTTLQIKAAGVDSGLSAFALRDDVIIEGAGATGLTVMTNDGRAGIDLIGYDTSSNGSEIHWFSADDTDKSWKWAKLSADHPTLPDVFYLRYSDDNGANVHTAFRAFPRRTADAVNANGSFLGNLGIGVESDLWASATTHTLAFAGAGAFFPTAAIANTALMYGDGNGNLAVLNALGETCLFTGSSPQWESIDAGAGNGPDLDLYRNSASPAASDSLGRIRFTGNDSGGTETQYASISGRILDTTDTSEDGDLLFQTIVAGSVGTRVIVGQGLYTSGATGGDTGSNSINTNAYYVQGQAGVSFNGAITNLTCVAGIITAAS